MHSKLNSGFMTLVIVACGIIVSRVLFVIDKKKNLL